MRTELYYQDAARTTILTQPEVAGTPGAQNSRVAGEVSTANIGPTLSSLAHFPVVPTDTQPVTIAISAADPDQIGTLMLQYRVDGQDDFLQLEMTPDDSGRYAATVPAMEDDSLVQFYVEAVDTLGNQSVFPPDGAQSRALYRVDNSFELNSKRHTFQTLMTDQDADDLHERVNMLDNYHRGITVVYDGVDVYYDAGARLRGSMFSRQNQSTTGYNVAFREDQKFRGIYESIAFDQGGENEIVVKFINLQSGNIGGTYDDFFELETPSGAGGGPTLVYMARHGDIFLDEQFGPDSGTLHKFEGIRVLTSTEDGEPESLKLYQPIGWVGGFDIQDLGDDKERYRWPFLINGNRAKDDFSGIMRMAKAFSAPDSEFEDAVANAIDIESWSRTFALMSLFGIGDAYSQGNPHNLNLYTPPNGEPVLAFPWDWDFVFSQPATAPIHGGKNLGRVFDVPTYEHMLLGQMHDLINTVFNPDYMTPWVERFSDIAGSNYGSVLRSAERRIDFVRGEFPAPTPYVVGTSEFTIDENAFLDSETSASYLIPSVENGGDQLALDWIQPTFEPSDAWTDGMSAVGFGSTSFTELVNTPVPEMQGVNASVYIRIPFNIEAPIQDDQLDLFLDLKYDDGFVAYLNGVRVASSNDPADLTWQSDATGTRRNNEAVEDTRFDLSEFKELLVTGQNVLAIHGMNSSVTSNDVLFVPRLLTAEFMVGEVDDEPIVTDDTSVVVDGLGWINIKELRLKGSDTPLPVRWTTQSTWEATVNLQPGENLLEIEAYDFQGELIGVQSVRATSTAHDQNLNSCELVNSCITPSTQTQPKSQRVSTQKAILSLLSS